MEEFRIGDYVRIFDPSRPKYSLNGKIVKVVHVELGAYLTVELYNENIKCEITRVVLKEILTKINPQENPELLL